LDALFGIWCFFFGYGVNPTIALEASRILLHRLYIIYLRSKLNKRKKIYVSCVWFPKYPKEDSPCIFLHLIYIIYMDWSMVRIKP